MIKPQINIGHYFEEIEKMSSKVMLVIKPHINIGHYSEEIEIKSSKVMLVMSI